jgi:hypothetical protein
MRKATMSILVLLMATVWLHAQPAGQAGGKTSVSTLEGCLQYTDGHYRLTDSSGTVHQLSLEANKLHHYVGQQVQVTGMEGVRTADTTSEPGAGGSTVKEQSVFKVKSVKHIADTCQK